MSLPGRGRLCITRIRPGNQGQLGGPVAAIDTQPEAAQNDAPSGMGPSHKEVGVKSPLDRGGLRNGLLLLGLLWGAATPTTILAGMPLLVVGTALHVWAKGCLWQNREVSRSGPYRYVRHPFYLANALIDAASAVMSGWWVLVVVLPVWWLAIYLPVMRREEAYLLSTFGEVYADYQRRIPRLLPWRRPLPRSGLGFSWRHPNLAQGREIPRALRILGSPLLFLLGHQLRIQGAAAVTSLAVWGWLGALVAIQGLAWGIQRTRLPRSEAREGSGDSEAIPWGSPGALVE